MNHLGRGLLGDATYQISELFAFQFQRRRFSKILLFLFLLVAMATRAIGGIQSLEQLWQSFTHVTSLPSFIKIGLVVYKEKMFKKIVDDARQTMHDRCWAITKANHEHFVLR